uniref:HD/PDEase domain-containing protein n=1 Tax=Mimivirus LCMiAC01 TaxID=2506608 RepID=A0A481Z0A2_9VIRU|nr:MAG: uncharacterized protein LCMiAC01_05310 [Mimivirus LCMiAC01]
MIQINKNYKRILDPIYSIISISNIAQHIIDTVEFQRLRYIKQLGACTFVFPHANHTRFIHSLGTYHLADVILYTIRKNSNLNNINIWLSKIPELKNYYNRRTNKNDDKLDDYVCELVKIAALNHDLATGLLSHIFDDTFLPCIKKKYNKKDSLYDHHEYRSGIMLEHIIKNNTVLSNVIYKDEIQFMKNLIDPKKHHKGFIYQIVSNNVCQIDVDKIDYLIRDSHALNMSFNFNNTLILCSVKVIGNNICFPKQLDNQIASLFMTRYQLHKQIYGHKTVTAIKFMINEIMILIDPIINLYDSIYDIKQFCNLTDEYIFIMVKLLHKNINMYPKYKDDIIKAYNIWININKRNIYKHINTFVSSKPINITYNNIKNIDNTIDQNDIFIHYNKIGYVSGEKKNPLKNIYFYDNDAPEISYKIKDISYLLSKKYQEYLCMIFVKDRTNKQLVEKMRIVCKKL